MILTTEFHENIKSGDSLRERFRTIHVTSFDKDGYKSFIDDLEKIRQADQKVIPIHIDSFGGQVYSLLGMLSLLRDATETIVTYTGSKAMSCGSILLACGSPGCRFVGEMATVMLHSVSVGTHGKIGEVEITTEEARRLNDLLFEILSERTKKKKSYFKKFLKDRTDYDVYLTPQETVQLGIADHIGVPHIRAKVSQSMEIGL